MRRLSANRQQGLLDCGPLRLRCALGRGGTRVVKREGDGATPWGRFGVQTAYFNPTAGRRPVTALTVQAIGVDDGWCDAAGDRNYNRPVSHPYPASAERLWRDDGLYDIIVVLDYNIRPRLRQRGSAIFMHVARRGYQPTEGCIALSRRDLIKVLRAVRQGSKVITCT
ncbi:MAG: L,D-transpeptidase family protein [Hyphomicrobium sp.]